MIEELHTIGQNWDWVSFFCGILIANICMFIMYDIVHGRKR